MSTMYRGALLSSQAVCGVAIPSEKKTKNAIGSSTNCCCKLVLQRHKKHHGVPRNNLLVRACIVATTFDSGSRKVCRRSGNGAYQEKCLGQAASRRVARLLDTLANKRRLHSLECLVAFGSFTTIYPACGATWTLPLGVAPSAPLPCTAAGGPLRYVLHNFLKYDHCKCTNDPLYINAEQRWAKSLPSSFGATWTLPLCVAPSALHRCGRASEVSPARQLAIRPLQIH